MRSPDEVHQDQSQILDMIQATSSELVVQMGELDLSLDRVLALEVGDRISVGPAVLEITQIGKECHTRCAIFHRVGDCVMPREGIFAEVLAGGVVRPGDALVVDEVRDQEPAVPQP